MREKRRRIFSCFLSFFNSLFWKRNRGATGNFEGNSSSFSFLFSLFFLSFNPSSFQFLGKEMRGKGSEERILGISRHRRFSTKKEERKRINKGSKEYALGLE